MKLPWAHTSRRELEAQSWAERSFAGAPPQSAARVALVLSERVSDDLEQIEIDRPLNEVGTLSELARVQLLVALEHEFGFSISEEDAEKINTPREIVCYVERWTDANRKS